MAAKKKVDKACHKKGIDKGCHKKGVTRGKPGPKPGFKRSEVKKIIGHQMPKTAQKVIESKYSAISKLFEQFGEHIASFVYNTNTEAGVNAMKMTPNLVRAIKGFKSEIRIARESLKPIFAAE